MKTLEENHCKERFHSFCRFFSFGRDYESGDFPLLSRRFCGEGEEKEGYNWPLKRTTGATTREYVVRTSPKIFLRITVGPKTYQHLCSVYWACNITYILSTVINAKAC